MIFSFERWGEDQADSYHAQLQDCCHNVVSEQVFPRVIVIGKKTIPYIHCQRHFIFFAENTDTVIILAVLHERMDFVKHLRGRMTH